MIRVDITGKLSRRTSFRPLPRSGRTTRPGKNFALQAETDRLQAQVDDTNRALAAASTPYDVQQYTDQRQDMLDQLQANALLSQAWTSWDISNIGLLLIPMDRRIRHQRPVAAKRSDFAIIATSRWRREPSWRTPALHPHHRRSPRPRAPAVSSPVPHVHQQQAAPILNSQASRLVGDGWSSRHHDRFPRLCNTRRTRRLIRST